MRKTLAAVAVMFLLSAGVVVIAQTTQPVSFDQSTPKGALKLFTKSIVAGDAAKVRSCLYATTPLEEQFSQAYSDVAVAIAKLNNAVLEKFGAAAARSFGASDGNDELKRIDSGKVQVADNRAVIDVQGSTGKGMTMVRVDGQWKVVVSQMLAGRDETKLRQDLATMATMAAAALETAGEVQTGRYSRVEQALQAYTQRLSARSTTQPAK